MIFPRPQYSKPTETSNFLRSPGWWKSPHDRPWPRSHIKSIPGHSLHISYSAMNMFNFFLVFAFWCDKSSDNSGIMDHYPNISQYCQLTSSAQLWHIWTIYHGSVRNCKKHCTWVPFLILIPENHHSQPSSTIINHHQPLSTMNFTSTTNLSRQGRGLTLLGIQLPLGQPSPLPWRKRVQAGNSWEHHYIGCIIYL